MNNNGSALLSEAELLANGRQLYESGQYVEAIDALSKAIQRNPTTTEPYITRAQARIELNQADEALQDLQQAITNSPRNARCYAERGNAYHRLGQLEKAVVDWDRALCLAEDDNNLRMVRAAALLELNKLQESQAEVYPGSRSTPCRGLQFARSYFSAPGQACKRSGVIRRSSEI
jgi:tetratricopeptide (TPR) repeat protein